MKISFLDGGMIFEINKKYKDFGEYSIENDEDLINNLYKNYIEVGCNFITTCNYCLKPSYTDNWENLNVKSINLMQKFRREKNNIKVLGSLPPFNKSYNQNNIDNSFVEFYEKLTNIFKNKVDYYIIETGYNFNEVKKIYDIVKKLDTNTPLIISIYPNSNHINYIDEYLNLDIFGFFINCCSCDDLITFYNLNLKNKNFNKIKFGFSCNKINEKKYSDFKNKSNVSDRKKNLQDYFENTDDLNKIKNFIDNLLFDEIYIGGCCGYGVEEMKNLIINLKN